jgi:hypothetical protein
MKNLSSALVRRRRWSERIVVVGALFVTVNACGDDESPDVATGIGPAGGVVKLEEFELVVPKGALARTTTITVKRASDAQASNGLTLVAAFELRPDGLEFAVPATARVTYAGNGQGPALFTSENGRTWSLLSDSAYDAASDVVRASVEHFSFIALQTGSDSASGGTGGTAGQGSGGRRSSGGAGGRSGGGTGGSAGETGAGGSPDAAGASGRAPVGTGGSGEGGAGGAGEGNQSGMPQVAGAGGLPSDGEGGGAGSDETPTCSIEGGWGDEECVGSVLSCYPGYVSTFTETGRECSDGHRYERNCEESGSSCACNCMIDGDVVGTCSYAKQACDTEFDASCDCDFPSFVDL